jgi:Clustered mitochondria
VWNYKFQKWLSSSDEYTKWIKLQKLAVDFVKAAELYGKIIISEFDPSLYQPGLPKHEFEARIDKLTIKPSTSIGGAAGGVKFIHNGILFKFALDWVRPFIFQNL